MLLKTTNSEFCVADIIDDANDYISRIEERKIQSIREAAADIPAGEPGECESCGLDSKRLVNNMCAPCRDMNFE